MKVEVLSNGDVYMQMSSHRHAKSVAHWALHVSASTAVIAAPQVLHAEAKMSGHRLARFRPVRTRTRADFIHKPSQQLWSVLCISMLRLMHHPADLQRSQAPIPHRYNSLLYISTWLYKSPPVGTRALAQIDSVKINGRAQALVTS